MIGSGSGLGEEIAVGVVAVSLAETPGVRSVTNRARLGIRGGEQLRQRIVRKSAGAPVGRVRGAALLVDGQEIVECVIGVIRFVI